MASKVSPKVHDGHGDRSIHNLPDVGEDSTQDALVSGTN